MIKTELLLKKDAKVWSSDSVEQLQGCFNCTDWDILLNSYDGVHYAIYVISDYINFCEHVIIQKKRVKVYPNNKLWVSKSLKKTLNENLVSQLVGALSPVNHKGLHQG